MKDNRWLKKKRKEVWGHPSDQLEKRKIWEHECNDRNIWDRDEVPETSICQTDTAEYVPSSWKWSNERFCCAVGRGRFTFMLCSFLVIVGVQAVFHHYVVQRSELIVSLMMGSFGCMWCSFWPPCEPPFRKTFLFSVNNNHTRDAYLNAVSLALNGLSWQMQILCSCNTYCITRRRKSWKDKIYWSCNL